MPSGGRQAEAQLDQGTFVDTAEAQRTTVAEIIERYRLEVTPKKKGAKQEGYRLINSSACRSCARRRVLFLQ
jgi:hypothetical protein